ncbi:hypothetical protein HPB51_011146 [Rhipicephalus microplus]|uniref:Uncharacterized protein n=1 Tax=Rhipicephalus microplus TaxID=6941 RepID=A0A9J6E0W4_RHIMP|nr:uncharacterized protein LOC119166921 [Rhipicephalus microplus]KAH8027916.1 hypothetical protein HPB51_011146 [Rhipicephalus microplus]
MGDETAEELNCSSSWPLLHSESLPSDADSGYEPSPAFSSARATFEWPPASEFDAAVEHSEMRSAAIPIPGRRQHLPQPLWPSDTVDVATQTSSLGEWPTSEAAHPGGNPPRPTPDLLFLPPPLFSATLVNLVGTTLPPDLVPRIEEQQRVPSYPSVMAGVQLRRIADDFARRRPPNGRRRSFPLSFFRFD